MKRYINELQFVVYKLSKKRVSCSKTTRYKQENIFK